jgi:acetyl esterase
VELSYIEGMRFALLVVLLAVPASAGVQKDIEYRNIDGKKLTLDVSVPDGDGPFPAVIIVHGGGWARGDKRSYVTPLLDTLTKANFVWFSIEYRMAPEFQFPAPAEDAMAAVQWVWANAAKYRVSISRVVLLGESAGAQIAAYVGARYGKTLGLAAVVDFYGPNDMVVQAAKERSSSPPGQSVAQYMGIKEMNDEATAKLTEASPITWVSKDIPPFLCVHGTADVMVPYNQSPKMCAAIQKAGGVCDVQTINDGAHGMGSWKAEWKPQLIEWLQKTLKLG